MGTGWIQWRWRAGVCLGWFRPSPLSRLVMAFRAHRLLSVTKAEFKSEYPVLVIVSHVGMVLGLSCSTLGTKKKRIDLKRKETGFTPFTFYFTPFLLFDFDFSISLYLFLLLDSLPPFVFGVFWAKGGVAQQGIHF
ncbi:hypothetical protein B0I37DRAFT_170471 [Chaetomium sp. MPI-CAGE-AT-0009]|nr:hypothetical protein B0I37DRAFT_170471 [Chaetomium sp. MPI-CAGE-AT-0009]